MRIHPKTRLGFLAFAWMLYLFSLHAENSLLTGTNAMGDWTADAPGVRRLISVNDLPAPYATPSARNSPQLVPRPEGANPRVPAGFEVSLFASGFQQPRKIITAPNGDIFVVDSKANEVRILRDANNDGAPEVNQVFIGGLDQPFGMAFYPPGNSPQFLYIANTGSVIRVPYRNGDLQARGQPQVIIDNLSPGGHLTGGGHWTRDIVFSNDGKHLYVSIGSKTNNDDLPIEENRARIFQFDPDGKNSTVYAWGIRNPVGIAIDPKTGALWTSANERDGLGDNLPPDYITRVKEGGFYGWPWFYIGNHQDPIHKGKHPELAGKVIVPDVLLQPHSASLCLTFYSGTQFPERYRGNIFACEHGSWNRERRTGYKIIMVPVKNGAAAGEYEDFMIGFVTPEGNVWGRPVGVTVAGDGSLLIADDGGNAIWRIRYSGKKAAATVTTQ